jgi:hypothetical protein
MLYKIISVSLSLGSSTREDFRGLEPNALPINSSILRDNYTLFEAFLSVKKKIILALFVMRTQL